MPDTQIGLEYTSQIFRRETARKGWYKNFCEKNTASNYKTRFENNELSDDKIAKILKFLGYEMVEKPIEATWRKIEDRKWNVIEEGASLGTFTAKTKEAACTQAAQQKYGLTDSHVDHKGRTKLIWELAICDLTAEEII
jgi:hypothetical protein